MLTLFVTGGALNAPSIKNQSTISSWAMLGSSKLLTLFLSVLDIFQQSRFSNFQFFKKNIKRCQKYPKGGPFCEFQIFGVLARNSVFLMACTASGHISLVFLKDDHKCTNRFKIAQMPLKIWK